MPSGQFFPSRKSTFFNVSILVEFLITIVEVWFGLVGWLVGCLVVCLFVYLFVY